jgi:hypothetical protein
MAYPQALFPEPGFLHECFNKPRVNVASSRGDCGEGVGRRDVHTLQSMVYTVDILVVFEEKWDF